MAVGPTWVGQYGQARIAAFQATDHPRAETRPYPMNAAGITSLSQYAAIDSTRRRTATESSDTNTGATADRMASAALDDTQIAQIRELASIDRKVRAHEAAHAAAAGGLAGSKSFSYTIGPDNVRYAIGGEVSISFGESSDPEVTLRNAYRVRAAALAPADPSPQDYSVAAKALSLIQQAQLEIAKQEGQTTEAAAVNNGNERANDAVSAFKAVQQNGVTGAVDISV